MLGKQNLVQLLATMLKARLFDETAAELFTQGVIPGFIHVGIGQEAIAAGVCSNLRTTDAIFVTHRGHAQIVAKGADLGRAMAELFGKAAGFCGGKAGSLHIADKSVGVLGATGVVGAGIPVATGAAFSYRLQGTDQVVACFFGDGSTQEGTFHESLNMASLWSLPIVYCCENNGWAQFTPRRITTKVTDIASKASAYGMPGMAADGDDVLAVHEVAVTAIERARKGDGPTLLEFKTHRWYGHYVGDAQKYRAQEEIAECRKFDPIARFEARLIEQHIVSGEELNSVKDVVKAEMDAAVKFAEQAAMPEAEEGLEGVYYEGETSR